ncbi:MAG: hypothetical protein ACLVHQ_01445 [Oscillospiraceae bacterium]
MDQDTDRSGGEICEDIEAACEDLTAMYRCSAPLPCHLTHRLSEEAEYP